MKQGMRAQLIYFSTVLLIAILASCYQFLHISRSGVRYTNSSAIYESLAKMEDFEDNARITSIKKYIEKGNPEEALAVLNTIQKNISTINRLSDASAVHSLLDRLTALSKRIENTKTSLQEIVSQTNPQTIFMVLTQKISNFKNIVFQRKWRTLARYSNILLSKTRYISEINKSFSPKNLRKNLNEIKKLVNKMQMITNQSVLSKVDKDFIRTHFKSLDTEIALLRKYILSISNFTRFYPKLQTSFTAWYNPMLSFIRQKQNSIDNFSSNIIISLLVLSSFLSISFLIGIFSFGYFKTLNKTFFESSLVSILDYIANGKNLSNLNLSLSKDVIQKIEKYNIFVSKRINLGEQLKEGIPLATVLFDSNLNLLWGNDLFYSVFNLKKDHYLQMPINWSQMESMTNLAGVEPVLTAIDDNIASIHQVQIKISKDKKGLPYEIYVTPFLKDQKKFVQIMFYPLSDIEDTLQDQIKTLLMPIKRSIGAIATSRFNSLDQDKLKAEFAANDLDELYDNIFSIYQNQKQERFNLISEIEKLESIESDMIKSINDFSLVLKEEGESFSSLKSFNNKLKTNIVDNIDLRYKRESLLFDLSNSSQDFITYATLKFSDHEKLLDDTEAIRESIEKISDAKNKAKNLKLQLQEARGHIYRSFEQLMVQQKINSTVSLQQKTDQRSILYNGFSAFDILVEKLNNTITTLDVDMSKLEILSKRVHTKRDEDLSEKFITKLEEIQETVEQEVKSGEIIDQQIIITLKDIFDEMLNIKELNIKMLSLTNQIGHNNLSNNETHALNSISNTSNTNNLSN